jgi:3-phosphoshikimate 1-carboxyvinyltransferase
VTTVTVAGGAPLLGTVVTPGDKSISHRALLLAALADGVTVISGLSDGADVAHTRAAVDALGAAVTDAPDGSVRVHGGRDRLHPPGHPVDCGNSGTGLRLLAGLVAGLEGDTVLTGDESLSARPMDRIAVPLAAMGATLEGRGAQCLPPLTVHGGHLTGIDWSVPMSSAQVKSCILLAGLSAEGPTVVTEAVATRMHTEEMLAAAGVDVQVEPWGQGGRRITLQPGTPRAGEVVVPGDPSQAAFWVVAGCLVPGSTVTVARVYGGAERTGFVAVLQRMGADVVARPAAVGHGPPVVDLVARASTLQGTEVAAAEIPSLDEVPALAVAAAAARGTTVFRDVGELRVKEVDRLAATAALVSAIGGRAEVVGDDLFVHGTAGALRHAGTASGGDHRMAMAAAVAALAAGPGTSTIDGFDAVDTSYPMFVSDLGRLAGPGVAVTGAGAHDRGLRIVAIDGPAGSGKSTVSRLVAARLGVPRLDTGAMYRSVAWAALERGIDPSDADAVAALAERVDIEVDGERTTVDGVEVTEAIRTPEVSAAVSAVAANPRVRGTMVVRQRRWAREHGGAVVEGRDIGTVVFPRAELKVYLDASAEERARRRADETAAGVARRDHLDSTRAASPLSVPVGARVLDTTGRSVEDVVEEVLSWL